MRVHCSASLPSTGLEWRCLIQQVLISYAAEHPGLAPLIRFMQNETLGHVCIYLSNPPSFSCHHFSLTTISTFLCMYCPILLSLIISLPDSHRFDRPEVHFAIAGFLKIPAFRRRGPVSASSRTPPLKNFPSPVNLSPLSLHSSSNVTDLHRQTKMGLQQRRLLQSNDHCKYFLLLGSQLFIAASMSRSSCSGYVHT
jgi:hypothetical protein